MNTVSVAVTAVAGIVAAAISYLAGRRTDKATAFERFTEGADRILERQSEEIDVLTHRIADLTVEVRTAHAELGQLRKEVLALREMVRALGGDPDQWHGWPT